MNPLCSFCSYLDCDIDASAPVVVINGQSVCIRHMDALLTGDWLVALSRLTGRTEG